MLGNTEQQSFVADVGNDEHCFACDRLACDDANGNSLCDSAAAGKAPDESSHEHQHSNARREHQHGIDECRIHRYWLG